MAGPGPHYDAVWIGLTCPRPELYERIEARVDAMLAAGWLREGRRVAGGRVGRVPPPGCAPSATGSSSPIFPATSPSPRLATRSFVQRGDTPSVSSPGSAGRRRPCGSNRPAQELTSRAASSTRFARICSSGPMLISNLHRTAPTMRTDNHTCTPTEECAAPNPGRALLPGNHGAGARDRSRLYVDRHPADGRLRPMRWCAVSFSTSRTFRRRRQTWPRKFARPGWRYVPETRWVANSLFRWPV